MMIPEEYHTEYVNCATQGEAAVPVLRKDSRRCYKELAVRASLASILY
jgi:hypothetical protein